MLSEAHKEFLTQVNPDAPIGSLMRHLWLSALLEKGLPGAALWIAPCLREAV